MTKKKSAAQRAKQNLKILKSDNSPSYEQLRKQKARLKRRLEELEKKELVSYYNEYDI